MGPKARATNGLVWPRRTRTVPAPAASWRQTVPLAWPVTMRAPERERDGVSVVVGGAEGGDPPRERSWSGRGPGQRLWSRWEVAFKGASTVKGGALTEKKERAAVDAAASVLDAAAGDTQEDSRSAAPHRKMKMGRIIF